MYKRRLLCRGISQRLFRTRERRRVERHVDVVRLRGPRRAAAIANEFLQQFGQLANDFRLFGVKVVLLDPVLAEVVEFARLIVRRIAPFVFEPLRFARWSPPGSSVRVI